jgi:hypothetical protein
MRTLLLALAASLLAQAAAPARTVEGASLQGHAVLDSETGETMGSVGAIQDQITVLPGVYDVMFQDVAWRFVKADGGARVTLRPGRVTLTHAPINWVHVRAADGKIAASLSATGSALPVPPGAYTIQIGGKPRTFTIAEGERLTFDAQTGK